jgi:hypothetical protein
VKVAFRNAVVSSEVPLRLVPKVLDAINVIVRIGKKFGMIDAVMIEL